MSNYVKAIDSLPWILRLIFALPFADWIVYGIYRICKGHIILGILWIALGWSIFWIIDLISVILNGKVHWLAW